MRAPYSAISFAFALIMLAPSADAQPGQVLSQQPPVRVPTPGQPTLQGESCIAGRVFGITSYQCTTCNMSNPRDSTHVVYTFSSEPLVVETDNPNRIRPGDRVVSVNGNPIMTRAGADQFAYPPPGMATIAVRRNNVIINFDQPVPPTRVCPVYFRGAYGVIPDSVQRVAVPAIAGGRISAQGAQGAQGGGGGRGGRGGAGGVMRSSDSLVFSSIDTMNLRLMRTADSARIARGGTGRGSVQILRAAPVTAEPINSTVRLRVGVTLTCHPICTFVRTRDGTAMYWRFDSYPTVANPAPGSVAAKAGLRDGDVLLSVNGISPQVEEGALILFRATADQTLRLEVRRDEKVEKITLKQ